MIGYPKFIMDPKELDKVFNDVSWLDRTPQPPLAPCISMRRMCPSQWAWGSPGSLQKGPTALSLGACQRAAGQSWGGCGSQDLCLGRGGAVL